MVWSTFKSEQFDSVYQDRFVLDSAEALFQWQASRQSVQAY